MEVSFELIEQFLDHDSNPVFQTEVRIEGLPAGTGTGYSKKESQQNAAQMAIKKVKDQAFMDTVNEVKAQHSMPPEAEAEALETKAEALEAEIAEPEVTDEIANDETGTANETESVNDQTETVNDETGTVNDKTAS